MEHFYKIKTRSEFKKIMNQIKAQNTKADLLYDCGSSCVTDGNQRECLYRTTKFKKGLRELTVSERFSMACSITTPVKLDIVREVFSLPDCQMNTPLCEVPFFKWLCANINDSSEVTGFFNLDLENFLATLEYDSTFYRLGPEQSKTVKYAHSQFFYMKHKGTLELNNTEPTEQDEPTELAPVSSSDPVLAELATFTASGDTLLMPKEQLNYYPQLKTLLQKADGVYRKNAFVFKGKCASEIQARLLEGEKLNDKKKFQMFWTPEKLGVKAIKKLNLKPEHTWFEPSAGVGNLAVLARQISDRGTLVEIHPDNVKQLVSQGFDVTHIDFMQFHGGMFDRIIGNPPFTNNQDIEHILKMYHDHLLPDGEMVSFASQSWLEGNQAKQVAFRNFLKSVGAEIEQLDEKEFSSSGTNVKTTMIHIKKAS